MAFRRCPFNRRYLLDRHGTTSKKQENGGRCEEEEEEGIMIDGRTMGGREGKGREISFVKRNERCKSVGVCNKQRCGTISRGMGEVKK